MTLPYSGPVVDDTGRPTVTRAPDAARTMLATCAAPRRIMSALGVAMTVTGNTSGGGEGPLTMSDCANTMATTRAPQEVLALSLAGSDPPA